ncbi:MAG: shikimate dehydrogenase [Roseiflexaceae bacterium]
MSTPTHYAGVIGDPVEHSRSPAMHNAAFRALGLPYHYERWHTPTAQLAERIASLRQSSMLGANVTLPHKVAILEYIDHRDPIVDLIGAANTIIRNPDGSLSVTNTDAPAVSATLREDAGFELDGSHAIVLGASGAARAAVYALARSGAQQIVIVNRTIERAEDLLADLLASTDLEIPLLAFTPDDPDLAEYTQSADLIINATSLGWKAGELPLEPNLLPTTGLVFDMVYRPTELLRIAAARGLATLDGRGMLVRQAGLAFERWVGKSAPLEVMFAAFDADQR